jgi:hypothetical protein
LYNPLLVLRKIDIYVCTVLNVFDLVPKALALSPQACAIVACAFTLSFDHPPIFFQLLGVIIVDLLLRIGSVEVHGTGAL